MHLQTYSWVSLDRVNNAPTALPDPPQSGLVLEKCVVLIGCSVGRVSGRGFCREWDNWNLAICSRIGLRWAMAKVAVLLVMV